MIDKARFGLRIYRMSKHDWSMGFALTHSFNETYLYFNLIKFNIAIGFIVQDKLIEIDLY